MMPLLLALLVIIALVDLRHYKIHNLSLVVLFVLEIALGKFGILSFNSVAMGLLLCVVLWMPYKNKWLGAGDIKLMAILSLMFTNEQKIMMVLLIFLVGGLWSAIMSLRVVDKKLMFLRGYKIPYGLPIVLVSGTALFLTEQGVMW